MATGTRTTDTFTEGLRKLLSSITDLKMTDDPDMAFIINLETMILQRLKQQGSDAINGAQAAMGGGGPMMPGGPMPGGPPPMGVPFPGNGPPGVGVVPPGAIPAGMAPPGMPPPGMAPPGAGVPGLMQGPVIPPGDELRRILSTGTTANRLGNVANRLSGLK